GTAEVPDLQCPRHKGRRGETDLPLHGPPRWPRNETWDKAISFGGVTGAMALNVATLPITVGAGAFLVRDGKLLVVRKTSGPSRGRCTVPSGAVAPQESTVQPTEQRVQ